MISKLPRWVWAGAAVLSFSAGMVNAIALLAFAHKAATHVTGIVSQLSVFLFERDKAGAIEIALILASFFLGALVSGILIGDGHLKMGRRYGFALAVECLLLLGAAWGFVRAELWGECLASMAAGLQNAMASTYSGTIVRTTHMTGVLTDIGALVGNRVRGVATDGKRLKLLFIIFFSFTFGGVLGAYAYGHLGPYAMLLPAATIGASAVGYEFFRRSSSPA